MPRTNTEIDRELSAAIANLRSAEITIAILQERVENDRLHSDIRETLLKSELQRIEERIRHLETNLERSLEQFNASEKTLSELKTGHEALKGRVEEDRRQRLQLWVGLILLLITFL